MVSTEGPRAEEKPARGGGGCLEGMFQKLCKERWLCADAAGEVGEEEGVGVGVSDGMTAGLVVGGGGERTCWGCCDRCWARYSICRVFSVDART